MLRVTSQQAVNSFNKWMRLVIQSFYTVGLAMLFCMMLLTFVDVMSRYVFNRPVTGSFDLTECMMAIMVSFSIAHCAINKGHVRIDLLTSRFSQRGQDIIYSITSFVGLGLFSLITWQSFEQMKMLINSELTSSVLLIPIYPFVMVVGIGSALLCLVLVRDFTESIFRISKK